MTSDLYKNLIVLVSCVVVAGLSLVLKLWPYGINRTFSQHVARHKTAIEYYIMLFLIILPLLLLYVFKWFIPTFHPTPWFGFLIILAAISHFACTLVPETGGKMSTIHRFLAFLSALCLLPTAGIIAFTPTISSIGRVVAAIATIVMLGEFLLLLKNSAEHQYLLIIQASYFALFFATLLTVTYTI